MNKKHRSTLAALRRLPTPANIRWADVEALAVALGATVVEGRGSRVAFVLGAHKGEFHRPHPGKEAKRYQIREFVAFLEKAGFGEKGEKT